MRVLSCTPVRRIIVLALIAGFGFGAKPLLARDAAFMDPGSTGGNEAEAIRVEPKNEIDTGDTILNVARRTTLFLVNQSGAPIQFEKTSLNSDGNVAALISGDDCSKQGTLPSQSRCSIEVSVTPSSPGSWSVDLLVTHNGAGRIVRAKLSGKTSGNIDTTERKEMGLALNTKDAAPVTFGDVDAGIGKAVRTALMINDSIEPITLYSIDVIEADNGLTRLDQGCAVDMELKPGESCPVTLVWTPESKGTISTDLIIRHSGKLGFAVIPIRGTAKGDATATSANGKNANDKAVNILDNRLPLPPPSQEALTSAVSSVAASAISGAAVVEQPLMLRLIGTVGNRAILLKPDNNTLILGTGESGDVNKKIVRLVSVGSKTADILVDGKPSTIPLEAAQELVTSAQQHDKQRESETQPMQSAKATPSGAPAASAPSSTPAGGEKK